MRIYLPRDKKKFSKIERYFARPMLAWNFADFMGGEIVPSETVPGRNPPTCTINSHAAPADAQYTGWKIFVTYASLFSNAKFFGRFLLEKSFCALEGCAMGAYCDPARDFAQLSNLALSGLEISCSNTHLRAPLHTANSHAVALQCEGM